MRLNALISLAAVVVVAVALSAVSVEAASGLTLQQCAEITPYPEITSCTDYPSPSTDILGDLPYNLPDYQSCVKQRCNCTGTAFEANRGIFCNSSGWVEDGSVTCNSFSECFENFWKCTTNVMMERYYNGQSLEASEVTAVDQVLAHGKNSGESFKETDTYSSCRQIMCAAADSRAPCGLRTCVPNYTQCYEYIRPPPLPYHHQLCTQGCQAALIMMALTLAVVTFALCCLGCCPPVVRKIDSVVDQKAVDEEEENDASDIDSGSSKKSSKKSSKDEQKKQ